MHYKVSTFRAAGLEAKWSKTRKGSPIIVARNPKARFEHQRKQWWVIDNKAWELCKQVGIVEGFDSCTALGDIFSVQL